jgi:hypothetical protein
MLAWPLVATPVLKTTKSGCAALAQFAVVISNENFAG